MPDCDYCGTSLDDEDAYLDHLGAEHDDELGRIERRRVDEHRAAVEETRRKRYNLALGLFLAIGVGLLAGGAYFFLAGGGGGTANAASSGGSAPHAYGSVHWHGQMEVVVDGHHVDFSKDRYQVQDKYFHFENGNGERWHVHGKGVTLAYGLDTLGIDVTNSSVTYDGTTYRESDPGTNVTVTVNGDPVTPRSYVLQDGDTVRVVVEQNESA